MKRYADLSDEQKKKALEKATSQLLDAIMLGSDRFNDELNQDDLQARIDVAIALAEANRTPWFAAEYIMDTCKEDIHDMAQVIAENALYTDQNENVIGGIA